MSDKFQESVKTLIKNSTEIYLSSNVTSVSHCIKTEFVNDDFDLYVFLNPDSVTAAQLSFNSRVHVLLTSAKARDARDISADMYAVAVDDKVQIDKIAEKWNKKYAGQDAISDLTDKLLYKLTPLLIESAENGNGEVAERLEFPRNRQGLIKSFFNAVKLKLKLWTAILRAPFFTASVAPVILGAAIAYHQQSVIHWSTFFLTLIGTIIVHAAANVINDYYDHRSGNDEVNIYHNAFSGGSRMIQNRIISPERTCFIAVGLFFITILIGLYLNSISSGNVILIIGIIGVVLAFTYSATPLKLSYRGIGELAIVASYGPLIVLGTYYVQTGSLNYLPLLAAIPNGILVGLILFINEFQDMQADSSVEKNTLVVRMRAKKRALIVYKLFLIFVFLWLAGFTFLKIFPVWTLLTMLVLPLVFRAISNASKYYDKIDELLPVNATTIGIHLITVLLFSLAFIIDVFL